MDRELMGAEPVSLERSDSGGVKRKGEEAEGSLGAAVKRTPSKEASALPIKSNSVVLRPHNDAAREVETFGSKATAEARRRSKFASLAAEVDNFEVEADWREKNLKLNLKPSPVSSPVRNHWGAALEPNPVASKIKSLHSVRFNEEVMSKTISTCPSTTDSRPSLDETLETVSDARGGDISSSVDSTLPATGQTSLNAAGIQTFFRPKPTAAPAKGEI